MKLGPFSFGVERSERGADAAGRCAFLFGLGAACALLAACAGSDGGPVGTGIAASVYGNLVDVQDGPAAPADGIAGVVVSVADVPGVSARTDETGSFELVGDFAGRVTLRFDTPTYAVAQPLDVPAGSVVVLSDIELTPESVTALSGRQLDLVGTVAAVDCAGATLLLDDRSASGETFSIRLLPETRIAAGADGAEVGCAAIPAGALVAVEGLVDLAPDGGLTALSVDLDPDPAEVPELVRRVSFVGRAVVLDCAERRIVIDDGRQRTRLRLRGRTTISGADGEPLRCRDVELGDRLVGIGTLDLRRPAFVQADRIRVARRGDPLPELRIVGFVAEVDCTTGVFTIGERDAALATVRIRPETTFRPPALDCTGLAPGQRLEVFGVPSRELRGILDAKRIRLKRPRP